MDEQNEKIEGGEVKIKLPTSKKLENFWYYYKWHTIAVLFVILVIGVCTFQTCNKTSYDLHVVYAGDKDVKMSAEAGKKSEYEELLLSGKPFSASRAHKRVCYLVAKEGREAEIEEKIRNTEGYFKGYETEVNFISEAEFGALYYSLYHKGRVCASGSSGLDSAVADFRLSMDSNPDFTAHVLLATARAAVALYEQKSFGAYTVFDIPPRLFFNSSPFHLI